MADRPTDLLVDLLILRIAEAVRRAGGALGDREAVRRAVVQVLDDDVVSPSEGARRRESDLADPDPVGAALGARLERALAEGVGEALRGQTLAVEPDLPRVVVLRERQSLDPGGPGTTSRETGEPAPPDAGPLETLVAREAPPVGGRRGLWVIAQGDAFEAAHAEAAALAAKGDRTITVRSSDEEAEVPGTSPGPCVELSAWEGAFGTAEETVRRTLERPSGADAPSHSRRAAWNPRSMVGELLHGRYRLNRLIGEGGFGAVYEATDERVPLETTYAIKILRPSALQGRGRVEAFQKEFERIQKCLHPNIVAVHNVDYTDEGLDYIVMERLVGEELDEWIAREERMGPDRAARVLLQILAALRKAHTDAGDRAILHLDLKPGNVFVSPVNEERFDEGIKVLDFGIGQYVSAEGPAGAGTRRSVACTPEYAAPEHCAHCDPAVPDEEILRLDGRADLYSLGVIGYQLLTGRLPHDSPHDRRELLRVKRVTPPKSVHEVGVSVPKKLGRFIDRCLEVDRERRWKDAVEAYEALSRIVHPVLTWRKAALVGGVPVLLLAGGLYLVEGGVSRRFALLDGSQALTTNTPLYLGPARAEVSLKIAPEDFAPERIREIADLRLVDPDTGVPPSWGYTIERSEPGTGVVLRLEAPTASGTVEGTYQLRGSLPGPVLGRPRGSVSTDLFRIELLDGEWEIDGPLYVARDARSGDTAGKVLDPDGLGLLYTLEGRSRNEVERALLRASLDEEEEPVAVGVELRRRPGGEIEDLLQAELDLTTLLLALAPAGLAGPAELFVQLEAFDLAGGSASSSRSVLELEPSALQEQAAVVRVTPLRWDPEVAQRYEFHKADLAEGVRFDVSLSRAPGELEWELLDDRGTRVGEPRSAARAEDGAFSFSLRSDAIDELVASSAGDEARAVYGRIRLTGKDSQRVIRADAARGVWEKTLSFEYVLQDLDFVALLNSRSAITDAPAGNLEYFLTGTIENVLEVVPSSSSDTRIEVRALTPGVSFENGETEQSRIARRLAPALFRFRAPEGEIELGVLASLPPAGGVGGESRTSEDGAARYALRPGERSYRIHVDRTAPKLGSWPPAGELFGADDRVTVNVERASFSVIVDDRHGGTLSWRMAKHTWNGDESWSWQDVATGSAPWRPGVPAELDFATPWWKDGIEPGDARWGRTVAGVDGEHRLFLTVTDGAGNATEAAPYGFEVAVHGPAIDILQPAPGGIWIARESEDELHSIPRFVASAVAFDPNGLRPELAGGFDGELVGTRDGAVVAREVAEFEVDPKRSGPEQRLVLERTFTHEWSEVDLRLTIRGADRFGNEGFVTTSCKLPHIERVKPAYVECVGSDRADLDVTPMRAVFRAGGLYEFGGRAKQKEVSDLARLGYQTFAISFYSDMRPWRVGLGDEQFEALANLLKRRREGVDAGPESDRDALGGHYYIDEHEVTRKQFRQFVLAEDGYARAQSWPCGSRPDPTRLAAWKRDLGEGAVADLPITGVTWA